MQFDPVKMDFAEASYKYRKMIRASSLKTICGKCDSNHESIMWIYMFIELHIKKSLLIYQIYHKEEADMVWIEIVSALSLYVDK